MTVGVFFFFRSNVLYICTKRNRYAYERAVGMSYALPYRVPTGAPIDGSFDSTTNSNHGTFFCGCRHNAKSHPICHPTSRPILVICPWCSFIHSLTGGLGAVPDEKNGPGDDGTMPGIDRPGRAGVDDSIRSNVPCTIHCERGVTIRIR